MKVISIFCFFLITVGSGISAGFYQEGTYRLKKFPEITRSLDAQITTIYQDEQGFMWFGSNRELMRFDGVNLQKFLEVDDSLMKYVGHIQKIISGGKDKILINMRRGLIDFDLKTGNYECYNFEDSLRKRLRPVNYFFHNILFRENDILWFGTTLGLIEYNREEERISGIYQIQAEYSGLANAIKHILPCDDQYLWISTANCLYKFDKKLKSFSGDILGDNISKRHVDLNIDRDSSGKLWFGIGGDLYSYDPAADIITIEIHDFAEFVTRKQYGDGRMFSNDSVLWDPATIIHHIKAVDDQRIMVAGNEYVVLYNHSDSTFNPILQVDPYKRSGEVITISVDHAQSIWFSDEVEGIFCAYRYNQPLHFFSDMIEGSRDILSTAYNIDVFDNSEIWIERHNGRGLARVDLGSRSIQEYPADGLGYAITRRCVRDSEGILWAIADGGLIYSFDPAKKQYRYFHCPDTLSGRGQWYFTMALDGMGHVWSGGAGGGLVCMDMKTGNYIVFNQIYDNSNGFGLMPVWQIIKIGDGQLLIIGIEEVIGITITENVQDDGSKAFDYHFNRYMDKNFEEIFHQYQGGFVSGYYDSHGNLWLGTSGNGVACYEPGNNRYRYYDLKNGLASNVVTGIIEDNSGKIWFATGKGLSRLDPDSGILRNVFEWKDSDYPTYSFDWWDIHKDPRGYLYFGVLEDPMFLEPGNFSYIEPDEKKIVLSDLRINNISQIPALNGRYPYLVNHLDQIRLNHKDHLISIGYGVLDYHNLEKYSYRYMLEGYDQGWIEAGHNTFLSYSNLPAGAYNLVVNYSTSQYFNEKNSISLTIIKSPAPWNTWWSWLGYGIIFIVFGSSIVLLVVKRNRARKQLFEEHKQLEKISEIEEAKTRFLTQLSHEIRTPLSLILQPVEALLKGELKGQEMKLYGMIRRNARRLNDLMVQILDFSRIESGKLTLNTGRHDILEFLRRIVANFNSLAESRNIRLVFQPGSTGILMLCFDPDQMEKVMNNLIANALKYTPSDGRVIVNVDTAERNDPGLAMIPDSVDDEALSGRKLLVVSVSDNGIGIPSHLHKRIFNRFDRGYLDKDHEFEGMGLGLSISKELVELHKGRIWVENNRGPGSVFYVVLPVDEELPAASSQTRKAAPAGVETLIHPGFKDVDDQKTIAHVEQDKASILFIEDNADMRRFVRAFLAQEFCFYEAEDGEKGLAIARERIPDIIVSDIMMPAMDGVEVVKHLKSDRRTCHIPVILLTAKAGKGDKVNALITGADDYIIKPFDIHELTYRIRNQLKQLERLRERSIRNFLLKDPMSFFNSRDDNFIAELTEVVNSHLDDPAFGVTGLSHEMGVSRTQLFRKLKAITGKQPNEFIRCIRVKKAAELLKSGSATITEIAYDTGFNSISYFSRCFKEIYHVTPSEYMRDLTH